MNRRCAPPGLLQPGTLVRWVYRLQLPDASVDEHATQTLVEQAEKALPEAGWEVPHPAAMLRRSSSAISPASRSF